MQIITEAWKIIPGYNQYEISNTGLVKSLKYNRKRILKQELTKGYLRVTLSKNNIQKRFQVHVLVAKMFCEGFALNKEVNHKDFNRRNNVYTNLEWVTRSENEKHTYSHGRKRPPETKYVLDLNTGVYYDSITEAAKINGFKMKTLSAKLSGQNTNNTQYIIA
jgi:hypothetical protein